MPSAIFREPMLRRRYDGGFSMAGLRSAALQQRSEYPGTFPICNAHRTLSGLAAKRRRSSQQDPSRYDPRTPAVQPRLAFAMCISAITELSCYHNLIAYRRKTFAYDFFVREWPVDLRCIEKGNTPFNAPRITVNISLLSGAGPCPLLIRMQPSPIADTSSVPSLRVSVIHPKCHPICLKD